MLEFALTKHTILITFAIYFFGKGTVSSSGNVTFDTPTSAADIGIDYTTDVQTLPIDSTIQSGQLTGFPRKIGKAIVELSTTYNIQVNSNDILLLDGTNNPSLGLPNFTGKKEVYTLGYSLEPNLTISQSAPLPFRVLGITTEVYY